MNPELKAKWVAALRGGEYKQCTEVLHNAEENSYCCWGVLRHIANPLDLRAVHTLTRQQLEEYGLSQYFDTSKLENMNDGSSGESPHNFAEIADYIEANL